MISDKTIRAVLDTVSLVDLVAETTEVKRQGANYVALCPFHGENTPSFYIRSPGNRFHCFGCQASGDVINYVMRQRGLDFPEAVRELAARAGIPVEEDRAGRESGERSIPRGVLYHITALAQTFFREQFQKAPRPLVEYVASRGIKRASMEQFGFGFCPSGGVALYHFLKEQRVEDDLMVEAGLVRRSKSGKLYDVFSGRLVFPVFVDPKRIAGFGGRIVPGIDDERERPKYLNSADTPIYRKHSLLYGLPQASTSIRKQATAYIVEGYLDVVAFAEAGIENVVACCGTALGAGHLKTLEAFARKVVLVFDGDPAGREAAGRSFERLIESRVELFSVSLPDGDDPDSFVRKVATPEEARKELSQLPAKLLLDSFLEWSAHKLGASAPTQLGPSGKASLVRDLQRILGEVENPVIRDELVLRASKVLSVDSAHIFDSRKAKPSVEREKRSSEANSPLDSDRSGSEEFSRLDQELVRAVMALRDPNRCAVHRNPEIVDLLHRRTVEFLVEFEQILLESQDDEGHFRAGVRDLLKSFGPSWVDYWRSAIEMRDKGADFMAVFDDCLIRLKRRGLSLSIERIDERLQETPSEEERADLAVKKLALLRSLQFR